MEWKSDTLGGKFFSEELSRKARSGLFPASVIRRRDEKRQGDYFASVPSPIHPDTEIQTRYRTVYRWRDLVTTELNPPHNEDSFTFPKGDLDADT